MPWEPLPDAQRQPSPLSEPLDRLLDALVGASASTIDTIIDRWPEIVGDVVAPRARPVKLVDAVLTVRADDAVVGSEVRWLEPTIVERVAELAGGAQLAGVKVVVGPPRASSPGAG